jgi:hypothetical protein
MCLHTRRKHHRRSALTAGFAKRIDDPLLRLTLERKDGMPASVHARPRAPAHRGLPLRPGGPARVAWMGQATVLAQAVGLGATWNTGLVRWAGEAASTEIRAMRAPDDPGGV